MSNKKTSFIGIRVPPALHKKIRKDAQENHRTVSSQITFLITQHLAGKEKADNQGAA